MTEYPSPDFLLLVIKIYQRLVILQSTLILNYEKGQPDYVIQALRNEVRQLEILLE